MAIEKTPKGGGNMREARIGGVYKLRKRVLAVALVFVMVAVFFAANNTTSTNDIETNQSEKESSMNSGSQDTGYDSEPERHEGYLTYNGTVSEMQRIENEHPDIAKMYNLGMSIEERDIWAIKISDNVALEEDEPEVLYVGMHHAREWPTHEVCMHYLNFLVDNYQLPPTDNDKDLYINEDPIDSIDNDGDGLIDEDWNENRVTWLIDNRQIWFVPIMNPDGLEFSQTVNDMWRKNRRNNMDGSMGVDNNRNYGYKWGYDDSGSSPIGYSDTYRGTGPWSEPENRAIRDLAENHSFIFALSYHTYGNMILYPWGYIDEDTPDHDIFVKNAEEMQKYNGYEHGNPKSGLIYNTNGDMDDYMYGNLSCFGYTFELGEVFHPPYEEVEELCLENLGANLYLTEAADNPEKTDSMIIHTSLKDTKDTTGPYIVRAAVTSELGLTTDMPLLHYKTDSTYTSVVMLPTGNPDEYSAEIPGQPANTDVHYYIEAKDVETHITLHPKYYPLEEHKFHVGPDIEPPIITHIPLENTFDSIGPYRVLAVITDNFGVVTKDTYYNTDGGVSYIKIPMEPAQKPDQYYADIPGQPPGTTIYYYIESTDNASTSNIGRDPTAGTHTFKVMIRPIADAGPDQESFSGRTVNFDGSNSYDPDGSIVNWTWDFGDGTIGYGETTTHIYSVYGNYITTLTVRDNDGATDTDIAVVTIWQNGHDLSIWKVQSPHNVRMGSTKTVVVWVKNLGSRYDYGLLSLTITAPDGTETTLTKIVKDRDGTSMNPGSKVKVSFSVNFNQRGTWTFSAHVDISDSNGNINPFPLKDCNPADNDGEPSYVTDCK